MERWSQRFLESTRGNVIRLLRREERTVNELAEALSLTPNAVRAHLTTLERDRLVRPAGKRPGVRKPEVVYALTPEAEQLFPKAYGLLLNLILDAVSRRLPEEEVEAMLKEVGHQIAAAQPHPPTPGTLQDRLSRAIETIDALGGLAELRQEEGQVVISGHSCPLGAVVRAHPGVCRIAEVLLTNIVGVPVREQCRHTGTPQCVFTIEQAETA